MASIIETMNTSDLNISSLSNLSSLTREDLEKLVTKTQIEMEFYKARMGHYTLTPDQEKIIFVLNHDLAQCKSKTELALQYIALYHYHNSEKYRYNNNNEKPVKLISIVFTNNSLLEGKAWKSRTSAKFKNQNILVQRLASDVGKNSDDFCKGSELLATFATYAGKEEKSQLGDVLIMCNHPQRINDMIDVLHTMNGLGSKVHDVTFKYNIYFDECDAGMCQSNLIRFVSALYEKELTHLIDEVQLITATPTEEMHRSLIKISPDAGKLLNLKNRIPSIEKGSTTRIKDYKTILDQEHIPFEGPVKPTSYVLSLNSSKPEIFKEGKIYFIPAHHYCKEHNKMANLALFQNKGYWKLVLNGKEKGFTSPLGEKKSILPDLKKGGELRDVLRKWRKENPKAGLVITGKTVLERGLTFLTDGFCFDYIILSGYFAKDMANLVQTLGRGQGNKKYVGNYKLVMPQSLHDKVKKYLEDCEEILENQPEYYDLDMIAKIGAIDKFACIEEPHFESSIDELNDWVKNNIVKRNGKFARIQVSQWKNKEINEEGFILHKFGESELKVWSEEEALQQRGGITPYSRRIFPCYTDTSDVTTLRWYVFYRHA
jgi:hypothetical protein